MYWNQDKRDLMRGIALHGALRCAYTQVVYLDPEPQAAKAHWVSESAPLPPPPRKGPRRVDDDATIKAWLEGRCDCKYIAVGTSAGLPPGSEQTGCPELRSAYALLDVIPDELYKRLCMRAQGQRVSAVLDQDPLELLREGTADKLEALAAQIRGVA